MLEVGHRVNVGGVPEGLDGLMLAEAAARPGGILHITRDDARMAQIREAIAFFDPNIEIIEFPAWDCLPYDRVSPNPAVASARMDALWRLTQGEVATTRMFIVLTTVNAVLQRVPARAIVAEANFRASLGDNIALDDLLGYLVRDGYARTSTVREPGEYAVRGGIVDIFPPGDENPLRLDFFGDTLDAIRRFDPLSQLTSGKEEAFSLEPVSEVFLDDAAIERFRAGYGQRFGATAGVEDPLYEAVSAGRKHIGMEHWLALFHDKLETLFDYTNGMAVTLDHHDDEARDSRLDAIADYYQARQIGEKAGAGEVFGGGAVYRALPPAELYLTAEEWNAHLGARAIATFSPFSVPEGSDAAGATLIDAGGRQGRDFGPERARPETNVFDAVAGHVADLRNRTAASSSPVIPQVRVIVWAAC